MFGSLDPGLIPAVSVAVTAMFIAGIAIIVNFRNGDTERMVKSGVWVAVFFGMVVLCLFLSDRISPKEHCLNCNAVVTSSYCEQCGKRADLEPTCPGCGEDCTTAFCGTCGTPMNPEG